MISLLTLLLESEAAKKIGQEGLSPPLSFFSVKSGGVLRFGGVLYKKGWHAGVQEGGDGDECGRGRWVSAYWVLSSLQRTSMFFGLGFFWTHFYIYIIEKKPNPKNIGYWALKR